jgi:hypothetical protein
MFFNVVQQSTGEVGTKKQSEKALNIIH